MSANKSCKPPKLCKDVIEMFSKQGDLVFDPFAGTGGVAFGAQMAGRRYMGCELESKQVNAYGNACDEMSDFSTSYDPTLIRNVDFFKEYGSQDAPNIEPFVDMMFTDPPYFDMDRRQKSSRYWKGKGSVARPMEAYGQCQFKSIEDWKLFIANWGTAARRMMKPNKYLVYFMEDMFIKGKYLFLTHISAEVLESVGFIPQGELIWYNEGRRPGFFGFPSKMITNRTHTSIIFMLNPEGE